MPLWQNNRRSPHVSQRIFGCMHPSFSKPPNMDTLTVNCWRDASLSGRKFGSSPFPPRKNLPSELHSGYEATFKTFARRNSIKKLTKNGETRQTGALQNQKGPSEKGNGLEADIMRDDIVVSSGNNSATNDSVAVASRSSVLQACSVTSVLIAALGVVIRQVCHSASVEGWPVLDCTAVVSFDLESWHLELITGLVVLISSCRYLLLKTWPDFAESSEAANKQVLSLLQPLDYLVVSFLPGASEELLFRGALLPLLGVDWTGAMVTAVIFGALHLGSGRKYSFALWATFVGFAYGYATILSSSIIVPMASHALNNLLGGILWRYTSDPSEKTVD